MDGFQLEYFFAVATFPDLEDLRFKACWPEVQGAEIFNHFDLPSNVPLLTLENVMVECVELARGLPLLGRAHNPCLRFALFDDGVLAMFAAPREQVDEANITPATEFGCDALRVLSIVVAPGDIYCSTEAHGGEPEPLGRLRRPHVAYQYSHRTRDTGDQTLAGEGPDGVH